MRRQRGSVVGKRGTFRFIVRFTFCSRIRTPGLGREKDKQESHVSIARPTCHRNEEDMVQPGYHFRGGGPTAPLLRLVEQLPTQRGLRLHALHHSRGPMEGRDRLASSRSRPSMRFRFRSTKPPKTTVFVTLPKLDTS